MAAAAFRFLRPRAAGLTGEAADGVWRTVAPAAELTGETPLLRKVAFEQLAGWTTRSEERTVFVLPARERQQPRRVVSAICPHEGCEVEWRAEERDFFCPCHDSRFALDGALLTGPAHRGLEELPARVENGALQIRFPSDAASGEDVQGRARA